MKIRGVTWRTKSGFVKGFLADKGINPKTGKRERKQFKVRGDAAGWLRLPFGDAPPPEDQTISAAGDRFIARCKAEGLEFSSTRAYRQHIDNHILPYWNGKSITAVAAVKPDAAEKFRDHLIATLSRAMAKKVLGTFRCVMDQAVRETWIEFNPTVATKIVRRTRDREPVAIPTPDEIRAIVRATEPGNERMFLGLVLVRTILLAGMRPSEARALREDDLHLDARPAFIRVERRVDAWGTEGPPKSAAGRRDIEIPDMLARTLRRWLDEPNRPKSKIGLVFANGDGRYLQLSNIHRSVWLPLQVSLGMTRPKDRARLSPRTLARAKTHPEVLQTGRYDIKALRHAWASLQIDAGVSPKKLQQQIGHTSISTTLDIYGHLWQAKERDIDRVEAIEAWVLKGSAA